MESKQIVGIIMILIGLVIGGLGLLNVVDLLGVDANNPMIKMGLAMQGTSMGALWAKFGGMSIAGIILLLVGIKFAKKPAIA